MPPEEGRRGDEEGDPALTRDDPTRSCEEDPIDDMELRSARRPLQHPKLMAEDEDLASVALALLATADEATGEGSDDEVRGETTSADRTGTVRARIGASDPHGIDSGPSDPCGHSVAKPRRATGRSSPVAERGLSQSGLCPNGQPTTA
jgi:hypothetical protein